MKKETMVDFTKENLLSNLSRVFFPLYIAYFCSILYDIIGSFFVGFMIGEKAFAAMSASVPAVMLYSALIVGATNGITIILSKYIGAKNQKSIDETVTTSLISLFILGIALTVLSVLGMNAILKVGNIPSSIFMEARTYLFIRILGFPFIELYMYFGAILRSYGNSSVQMITIIISTVINIALDPIMIIRIGINGAAIATLIAQIISVAIMLFFLNKAKIFRVNFRYLKLRSLKEIARYAIPTAIQQSIPTISIAYIQALFSSFGVTALAAYGVASKLEIVLQYPGLTINMTETTAIGTCYGSNNIKLIKKYIKYGIFVSIFLVLFLTPFITTFSTNLSLLFGVSLKAASIVTGYFMIVAIGLGYVLNCVINTIMGEMNGMGKQVQSMILMALYFIVLRFPIAKILSGTPMGANGISLSILITYIFAAVLALLYHFVIINKKISKMLETEESKSAEGTLDI